MFDIRYSINPPWNFRLYGRLTVYFSEKIKPQKISKDVLDVIYRSSITMGINNRTMNNRYLGYISVGSKTNSLISLAHSSQKYQHHHHYHHHHHHHDFYHQLIP